MLFDTFCPQLELISLYISSTKKSFQLAKDIRHQTQKAAVKVHQLKKRRLKKEEGKICEKASHTTKAAHHWRNVKEKKI